MLNLMHKQALHVVIKEIFWICFIKHWKPKNQTKRENYLLVNKKFKTFLVQKKNCFTKVFFSAGI